MKSEPEMVIDIIREVGVSRLGFFDGCICSRFSLRGVDVEISCGKGGERGVSISSPSLDYYDETTKGTDESKLRPIAEEVQRQAEAADHRGALPISFKPE